MRLLIKSSTSSTIPSGAEDAETLITHQDQDLSVSLMSLQSGVYTNIYVVEIIPDEAAQTELYRLLKPSAKLMIDGISDRDIGQSLSVDLKIQGFLDIMAAKDPSTSRRFVVCQKPSWESGATAKVNIIEKKAWKVLEADLAEEELVDEDSLLQAAPVPKEDPMDCGTDASGKRRACANCTCGLADKDVAEMQAVVQNMSASEKIVKASSCGNCAKGDAFRCASCPFLGKPAFEPGMEKVILAMDDDI